MLGMKKQVCYQPCGNFVVKNILRHCKKNIIFDFADRFMHHTDSCGRHSLSHVRNDGSLVHSSTRCTADTMAFLTPVHAPVMISAYLPFLGTAVLIARVRHRDWAEELANGLTLFGPFSSDFNEYWD